MIKTYQTCYRDWIEHTIGGDCGVGVGVRDRSVPHYVGLDEVAAWDGHIFPVSIWSSSDAGLHHIWKIPNNVVTASHLFEILANQGTVAKAQIVSPVSYYSHLNLRSALVQLESRFNFYLLFCIDCVKCTLCHRTRMHIYKNAVKGQQVGGKCKVQLQMKQREHISLIIHNHVWICSSDETACPAFMLPTRNQSEVTINSTYVKLCR